MIGQNSSTSRQRFTPLEDMIIRNLAVNRQLSWDDIAKQLPGRTGRQCRDRYNKYLTTFVVNREWTDEEDNIIIQKYKELGPRWTQIAQFLEGRNGNNVKNRWYKHLKKVGRIRESKHKSIEPQLPLHVDIDKIWANLENELSFNNDYETSFRFD